MSITRRWSKFNQANIKKIPNVFGAYELADSSKIVIYIGNGQLFDQLQKHYLASKTEDSCFKTTRQFRCEETGSKARAEQREHALKQEFERKYGRMPRCNQESE